MKSTYAVAWTRWARGSCVRVRRVFTARGESRKGDSRAERANHAACAARSAAAEPGADRDADDERAARRHPVPGRDAAFGDESRCRAATLEPERHIGTKRCAAARIGAGGADLALVDDLRAAPVGALVIRLLDDADGAELDALLKGAGPRGARGRGRRRRNRSATARLAGRAPRTPSWRASGALGRCRYWPTTSRQVAPPRSAPTVSASSPSGRRMLRNRIGVPSARRNWSPRETGMRRATVSRQYLVACWIRVCGGSCERRAPGANAPPARRHRRRPRAGTGPPHGRRPRR